ncbi:MAG: hypothetical protein RLZZ447_608 [Verrucomicrobiota bacterium]|jgi:APA family basic amino acid/polyamine antiporter
MLEYGVSEAAIAVGWGQYLNEFLVNFGWHIPARFANPPGENGGMLNLPAAAVVLACMVFLLRGASESSRLNNVMVLLKIAILVFFAVVAVSVFDGDKFSPFMPLGVAGIGAAAGQVFFSYIGFDAASTAGEEAKNPRRDLPIAIIGSLIIVTALYLLVAAVTIGAHGGQPADYQGQAGEAILARIAGRVTGGPWAGALIALGAVISIFSVVLCTLYGQTRVLYAMSRDGLLPAVFRQLDPRTGTPVRNTVIVSLLIAVLASLVPLGQLAEATSIGTLLVFGIVNLGVISLRRSRPELPRTFRTPLYPFTPLFGLVGCLYLITSLDRITWLVFAAWMVLGLAIYFSFGFRRSHLAAVPAAGVS